ncbi:MAG TPA: alpha/beta hydrolase-fold protein [Spirochaetota bacterium]|nr:alpha/beta hydrolase-fold protein [Spirochaetota bacterium]HOL56447.1 alpha/beta hydrolase-fold protein [Spirochaetota bacterium]HPP04463.1 alpha/beta hydrolase-fold protein [Spirochaetota bacterium]
MKRIILTILFLNLFSLLIATENNLIVEFNNILKIKDNNKLISSLNEFVIQNRNNIPIIQNDSITFIYIDQKNEDNIKISLSCSENNFNDNKDFFKRAGKTNFYYITYKTKNIDNFTYQFIVHKNKGKDKLSYVYRDIFNPNIQYGKRSKSVIRTFDSTRETLQIITDIEPESKNLLKRDIYVYLPPGYWTDKDKRYPVLYMHDGNNLWDSKDAPWGGWKLDTTTTRLINEGEIEPIIIVGIANTSKRMHEYIGWSKMYREDEAKKNGIDPEKMKALTDSYENFIIKQIKPFIDSKYRTLTGRDDTGMGGSSAGAMISLYMGFKYPDYFSKIIALSGGFEPYIDLRENHFNKNANLKIYLDCGTKDMDGDMKVETINLYEFLKKNGYRENDNLLLVIDEGASHNEKEWAKRANLYLKFMFGKR